MALAKCVRCEQLFSKVRSPVCPKCQVDEDADYDKVRVSLEQTPNQSADQVAEATGVSRECVMRMIDEGAVQNISFGDAVQCGRCGAPAISLSKRLCQSCLDKLNMELARAQSQIKLAPKKQVEFSSGKVHDAIDHKRKS